MDVIDRVKKIQAPLLVIGLGGTGIEILKEIKDTFAKQFVPDQDAAGNALDHPPCTAYLGIDTDEWECQSLPADESIHLGIPGFAQMLHNRKEFFPHSRDWLDPRIQGHSNASFCCRQLSRLLLSGCYQQVAAKLTDKLHRLMVQSGPGRLEIVICTGLCGSTGSGLFLDLPQIIRHILPGGCSPAITGYFVLPDAAVASIPSCPEPVRSQLLATGYAALKELDFWQQSPAHKTPYTIQYTSSDNSRITWTEPPYDSCVLLSATDVMNQPIPNPRETLPRAVAENLLLYMAQEAVFDDDSFGAPEFSYVSHENNQTRLISSLASNQYTPLYHGYRAIGTATMSIPWQKIFACESARLIERILPATGLNGTPAINTQRIDQQTLPDCVRNVLPPLRPLLESAIGKLLPSFVHTPITDRGAISVLQEGQPPHDRLTEANWIRPRVFPAACDAAREYLEKAWGSFVTFAEEVITAPGEGPFSLYAYLRDSGENGFMASLDQQISRYRSMKYHWASKREHAYGTCRETLAYFQHPPLLARARALETYMDALRKYYEMCIAICHFETYLLALNHLRGRIQTFLHKVLSPLCNELIWLHRHFTELAAKDDPQDLIRTKILKDHIDSFFAPDDLSDRILIPYLNGLTTMITATTPSQDEQKHYITFDAPADKQIDRHSKLLHDLLDAPIRSALGGALDALLMQEANNDPQQLQRLLANKLNQIKNAAVPLFADRNILSEEELSFTYLSLPANSELLKNFIADNSIDVLLTPKCSYFTDRIQCLITWDGLSLLRYGMLDECAAAYARCINDSLTPLSAGLHLVRTRESRREDISFHNDWSLLPEPAPYYFLSSEPNIPQLADRFPESCKLIEDAVACGQVTINDSFEYPIYTFRRFLSVGAPHIARTAEDLAKQMDEILASPADQVPAQLDDLLSQADEQLIHTPCAITVMRNFCGFQYNTPVNPFDPSVPQMSETRKTAVANFHRMALLFGAALLMANPVLHETVQMQLPAFQRLAKERNA